MAIKIDNDLLSELGLNGLPDAEKNSLLRHIYETLEMRVGMRLADQMSNEQLDEFEQYFEAKDDAGAFKWLETNFPNYKEIVQEEFDKLKAEVGQSAPQILTASQAQAQALQSPQGDAGQQAALNAQQRTAPQPQAYGPEPAVAPQQPPQYQQAPPPQPMQPPMEGPNTTAPVEPAPGYAPQVAPAPAQPYAAPSAPQEAFTPPYTPPSQPSPQAPAGPNAPFTTPQPVQPTPPPQPPFPDQQPPAGPAQSQQ